MGLDMGMGPVQKVTRKRKEKWARGRLLFAPLALDQQPTGTAIKVPICQFLLACPEPAQHQHVPTPGVIT
jgi:hypothetical protein